MTMLASFFVDDFDYFVIQIMFQRLWRELLFTPLQHAIYHCNGN